MSFALLLDHSISDDKRQKLLNEDGSIRREFTHVVYSHPDRSTAATQTIQRVTNQGFGMEFLGYVADLPDEFAEAALHAQPRAVRVAKTARIIDLQTQDTNPAPIEQAPDRHAA